MHSMVVKNLELIKKQLQLVQLQKKVLHRVVLTAEENGVPVNHNQGCNIDIKTYLHRLV